MALGASIYKVSVNLCNLDSHYYQDLELTIAKHPSENEARMMFRLLAFLYCAHQDLEFSRGLSNVDEPALWQKNYAGDIVEWIDLGLPELKRIRQSLGRSQNVKIFTYHENRAIEWYEKLKDNFVGNEKLQVFHFRVNENGPIDKFVSRSMKLSCLIEDGNMQLSNDNESIGIAVVKA